jgi:hypothetical protein
MGQLFMAISAGDQRRTARRVQLCRIVPRGLRRSGGDRPAVAALSEGGKIGQCGWLQDRYASTGRSRPRPDDEGSGRARAKRVAEA